MFAYEVMNEQQAMQERFQLLKMGEYDAVIESSIDKVSSSGNPMMDMTLSVFDEQGRPISVRDFLVFTKGMMWKVVHFANSADVLKEYEEQKLCSELVVGRRVKVRISIEEGRIIDEDKLKGKPLGSKYPDKNKVDDYIVREESHSLPSKAENEPFADDDLPF